MRIETNTQDRLVVISRPWIVTVTLMGLGALAVFESVLSRNLDSFALRSMIFALGLGILWLGWAKSPFLTLDFDRPSGTLTVTHHRITGKTSRILALTDIHGALHESEWSDGSRLNRLALRTRDGSLPVEFGFSNASRQNFADAIDAWIGHDSPNA